MSKMTGLDFEMLQLGSDMEHMGGFCAVDRRAYRRAERLREKGLLKFFDERKSRFWSTQFFAITDRGVRVLPAPLPARRYGVKR